MSYIATFIFISSGSVLAAAFLKRRFEEVIPLTIMAIILSLYIFGLFGSLLVGYYVVIASCILCWCAAIYSIIKRREIAGFLSRLFTPGAMVFVFLYVIICYMQRGRMIIQIDEYRLWGSIVKTMHSLNTFGTSAESQMWSTVKSYPPGMALFQYFMERLRGSYSDGILFIAYEVFCFALLMPVLAGIKWKDWRKLPLLVFVIMILPLLFFNSNFDGNNFYTNIFIDCALGMTFGYAISLTFIEKELTKFSIIRLSMSLAVLCLLKDTGLGLAFVVLAVIFTDLYLRHREAETMDKPQQQVNMLYKNKYLLVAAIITFSFIFVVSWKTNVAITHASVGFAQPFTFQDVINCFNSSSGSYRVAVLKNFWDALLNKSIVASPILLSYKTLLAVFVGVFLLLYWSTQDKSRRRIKAASKVLLLSSVLYVIGMLYLYLFKMPIYEAASLPSYPRYMSIYFCGLSVYVFYIIVPSIWSLPPMDYQLNVVKKSVAVLTIFLLLMTPIFIYGGLNAFNRNYSAQSAILNSNYSKAAEDILGYIPESRNNFKVYIIIQGKESTTATAYFSIRYHFLNTRAQLNSNWWSWNVKKDFIQLNSQNKDSGLHQILMEEYDYVYLYQLNDTFSHDFEELFKGGRDTIHLGQMYQVIKGSSGPLLQLCSK